MTYWMPLSVNPCPSDHSEQIFCFGNLTTVACRITDCNRIRSVEAEYDNNTAIAKCVALNDTHFRILLFHGESQKDIVVVIQKISGCNLIFEEEYHAIMNAARYGEIAPRETPTPEDFKKNTLDEQSNSGGIPLEHNILEKSLVSEKSCVHYDRRDIHIMAIGDSLPTNPAPLS
eukprot:CAMPEP_0198259564 /NCGR_PEP_ID=MMETSP1447-20131203/8721_1 /TAXON_ID=420782 /ORGANISM="Chaetoceros dichaeta, Strain CCMP1751" /LENGTH=173 /DNA_ID=CAMNT_0043946985 /DNA_START=109 /DNA_END=630 /DNA_ORIENTATION=-